MNVQGVTRASVALFALIAGAAVVGLAAPAAVAAPSHTRYVATTGDDTDNDCTDASNPCLTIQNGVDQADPGDTVSVAAGTYHESVRIRKSLTIVGAGSTGSGRTTIDGPTESGPPSVWIDGSDTDTPPDVILTNLDVSNYRDGSGTGIEIDGASATITDCTVDNNIGTGILIEGLSFVNGNATSAADAQPQVDGDSSVTINTSTVNENGGSGITDEGVDLTVNKSTLDHNAFAGIVDLGVGDVTVNKSTISHTVGSEGDGGLQIAGGLAAIESTVAVNTSTIYGNAGYGIESGSSDVAVNNTTISATHSAGSPEQNRNQAGISVESVVPAIRELVQTAPDRLHLHPAALQRRAATTQSELGVFLTGSIDADNGSLPDCDGTVTDNTYNLASDDSCDFSATGSKNSGHALLGPLQNNGGPTKTAKPAKHSDAVDKIPTGAAGCSATVSDQRGVSRPQGGKCDEGAVEDAQPPIVFHPNALPNGTVGTAYHATITATGGLGAPYTLAIAGGSLPPGLSFDDGVITGTPTTPGTFHITVSVDDPTLHHYTIVIIGPSTEPIANTGAHVRPLANLGVWSVVFGIALLLGASWTARWARRYRRAH